MIHTKKDEKILAELIAENKISKMTVDNSGTLKEIVTHVIKAKEMKARQKDVFNQLGIRRAW